jgi:hypothetical protein
MGTLTVPFAPWPTHGYEATRAVCGEDQSAVMARTEDFATSNRLMYRSKGRLFRHVVDVVLRDPPRQQQPQQDYGWPGWHISNSIARASVSHWVSNYPQREYVVARRPMGYGIADAYRKVSE